MPLVGTFLVGTAKVGLKNTIASAQYTIIDFNDIYISNTPPINPALNQLWLDTSVTPNMLKRWDGTQWVVTQAAPADNNLKIRYIRDYLNGNSVDTSNRWVEIKVMSGETNLAKDIVAISNLALSNASRITDDDLDSDNYAEGFGEQYVEIDLGEVHQDIDYIRIWHYYNDERIFNKTKTEVSEDGETWITLFDSAVNNTYAESYAGRIMSVSLSGSIKTIHEMIQEVNLKLTPDSIMEEVRKSEYYKSDLNMIAGRNKWLVRKYSIKKYVQGVDDPTYPYKDLSTLTPNYEDLTNRTTSEIFEVPDSLTLNNINSINSYDNNFICLASTYVKASDITSLDLLLTHNLGASIYINGNAVYDSLGSSTKAASISFNKGWNKIEILWFEDSADDKFTIGTVLSQVSGIEYISCYYNIESISEGRIKIAEDEIDIRVRKDNIIASINASTENGGTVQIEASKINLTGYVEITDLDQTGSVIIDGGRIKAKTITADQIKAESITANELKSDVGEYLDLSSNKGLNITIGEINEKINGQNDTLNNVNTFFHFESDGLNIGKTNSPLQVSIDNTSIQFIDMACSDPTNPNYTIPEFTIKPNAVAWINGKTMHINSLEVLSNLVVGVHKIEKYNDNITVLKWIGGNN